MTTTETNEKINILLVDDRDDGRLTLQAVLDQPDYCCVAASSGIEALKLAAQTEFALILLDVQMPGMDGFETASRLRYLEKTTDTPIIFVTAINKEASHVYKGYDSGGVDYIFKPFDPQILKSKVSVLIELFKKNKTIKKQSQLLLDAERNQRIRQVAELELENLKRYRKLADAIPHIVWKSSSDGQADYFNKFWEKYTGLSLMQSLGKGWQNMFNSDDLNRFLEIWEKAQEQGRNFETEARIRNGWHGPEQWHLVRGIAEIDENNRNTGWIITCTDIHSLKESGETLARQAKELARSNKELEQYAFSASHDLQEPLRKILNFGDLLQSQAKGLSETSKDHLNRIQKAAQRMSQLISDLLRYSRLNTREEMFEMVDLNDVVQEAISTLELQLKNSDGKVEVDNLPTISGSRIGILQIIQNLLNNALKFRSTISPLIKISAERKDNEWLFSCADNGIGMDNQHTKRIFDLFQRLHSSHEYPGTGIGLAVVKKIVEGHGGHVWVESKPGEGSTFFFTIPMIPLSKRAGIPANN